MSQSTAPTEDRAEHAADVDPAPPSPASRDVASLSYESARDELVDVVRRLEAGGEPLEASLALWERGEALAARCQQWLDGARARLDARSAGDAAGDVPASGGPIGAQGPAADRADD